MWRSFINCKCFCVKSHCLHSRDPLLGPSLKCPQSSLMTGSWLGVFCAVSSITPWPDLPLAVLQPGLGAQHPRAHGIFLKVIAWTTVPPCFFETAPGRPPWVDKVASWSWMCQLQSSSGRCWTFSGAQGCVMRGLVVWGKTVQMRPLAHCSLIHSTREFSIYH